MQTAAPAAPAETTSVAAILASNFSPSMSDNLRNHWTAGKMRHLIAALDGIPVAITTDRQTGHTRLGVKLTGIRSTPGYGTFDVIVEDEHGKTAYTLNNIGEAIIPLERRPRQDPKWAALRSFRDEQSAALRRAQSEFSEEHPDADYDATWDVRNGPKGATVARTRSAATDAGAPRRTAPAYWHRTYTAAELA